MTEKNLQSKPIQNEIIINEACSLLFILKDYINAYTSQKINGIIDERIITYLECIVKYIKTEAQNAENLLININNNPQSFSDIDSQGRNILHYSFMLKLSIKNTLVNNLELKNSLDNALDTYGKHPQEYEDWLERLYALANSIMKDASPLENELDSLINLKK